MRKNLFIFFFALLAGTMVQGQSFEELMEQGEKFKSIHNEPLALAKYSAALEIKPNDYAALHNASFLLSKIGNRLSSDEDKKKYFTKAEEYARKAIKANPNDAEGYFVLSVAMGRIALIASAKERVAASTDIKENAEKALKFNNQHAGAWDVLGRWNLKVANLSFAEKTAANVLFGGLPKGASNENAIKCFNNAIKYDPNYILFHYDLAGAYYYNKQIDMAKKKLNEVINMKPVTPDDPGHIKKAKAELAAM